jgi:hypothetical protein
MKESSPDEPNVLHGEIEQCVSMVQEVRDESMIEVDESDKGLYLLLVSWSGPVCYSSDLNWIHFNLIV